MLITIKFMRVMESNFQKYTPYKFSNGEGGPGASALDPPLNIVQ